MPSGLNEPDQLLTTTDVAKMLLLSEQTVRALFREGKVPGAMDIGMENSSVWRIWRSDLERWLDSRQRVPRQTVVNGEVSRAPKSRLIPELEAAHKRLQPQLDAVEQMNGQLNAQVSRFVEQNEGQLDAAVKQIKGFRV